MVSKDGMLGKDRLKNVHLGLLIVFVKSIKVGGDLSSYRNDFQYHESLVSPSIVPRAIHSNVSHLEDLIQV